MANYDPSASPELYAPEEPPGGLTGIRGPVIAMWTLALVTVFLRFASRKISKAGFWYDDWFVIPSIVRQSPLP